MATRCFDSGIRLGSGLGIGFELAVFYSLVLEILIPGFREQGQGRLAGDFHVWRRTQFEKHAQRLIELTIVGGLEAKLERERVRGIGHGAEGHGGQDGSGGCLGGFGFLARPSHLQFEGGRLDSPDAEQTPASGDHGLHQRRLGEAARLELERQRSGEVVEAALGFAFEHHCAGDEGTAGGVLRRDALACRGDWAGGLGGVGSIGSDLTFGCHDSPG